MNLCRKFFWAGLSLFGFGASAVFGQSNLEQYNLVVLEDLTTTSHVDGRTFVGGDLYAINGPVFSMVPQDWTMNPYALTVAGNVIGNGNLQVNSGGSFRHGGSIGPTVLLNGGGSLVPDVTIDVTTLSEEMSTLRGYLLGLEANSTFTPLGNHAGMTLQASGDAVAVFDFDSADLFNGYLQTLDVAFNGSETIVFNVGGTTVNVDANLGGTLATKNAAGRIIWNFYEATSITFNRSFWGTVLAPDAALIVNNSSNIDGGVYVRSLETGGEIHLPIFVPELLIPEPAVASYAGLAALGLLLGLRRAPRKAAA